jgi:hypothetical protein
MSSIGGYFGLELNQGSHYHDSAIELNTGRCAFEYILRSRNYKKVFLPYFTCEVMLEPINKLGLAYEFYSIDIDLEPVFDLNRLQADEVFVYTNYFGFCNEIVKELSKKTENIIIDNSQAFYAKPILGVDTFYSARKFFGVPDGAYLYTDKILEDDFEMDSSYNRMSHLLIRTDGSAEDGYNDFKMNDNSLSGESIKKMSQLTSAILGSIDYETVAQKRIENFRLLDEAVKKKNKFHIEIADECVPMVYPFWGDDSSLKSRLQAKRIYCATYWPNVKYWCSCDKLEYKLTDEAVYLPVDQRYELIDMNIIIEKILNG